MKLRSVICLLISFMALSGLSNIAYSQPTDLTENATVYKRLSPKTVSDILKAMGFEYKEAKAPAGFYVYGFDLGGFGVALVLHQTGEVLEIVAKFPMNPPPPVKAINEWNRTKIFSVAYFDDEGNPTIGFSLNLTGGVSRENIKEFIKNFRVMVTGFVLWLQTYKTQ